MAKDFAKTFYKSKAWLKLRQKVVEDNFYICSKCHKSFLSADLIVHHKIELTADNINDASIALNYSNLILLCRNCHNIIHGYYAKAEEENRFIYDGEGNIIDIIKNYDAPLTK